VQVTNKPNSPKKQRKGEKKAVGDAGELYLPEHLWLYEMNDCTGGKLPVEGT
jgi:hypothetical protein